MPKPASVLYVLPNLVTLGSMFCGFYAIVVAFSAPASLGTFGAPERLLLLAALLDMLDGRIARWTRTQSQFGTQLDSLADLVSFGIAPALVLLAHGAFTPFGWFGLVSAFAFAAAGALRLARFNVLAAEKSDNHSPFFVGLPIPVASSALVVLISFWPIASVWLLLATSLLAVLMVSNLPFRTFKALDSRTTITLASLGALTLIFVLLLGLRGCEFAFIGYLALAIVESRISR